MSLQKVWLLFIVVLIVQCDDGKTGNSQKQNIGTGNPKQIQVKSKPKQIDKVQGESGSSNESATISRNETESDNGNRGSSSEYETVSNSKDETVSSNESQEKNTQTSAQQNKLNQAEQQRLNQEALENLKKDAQNEIDNSIDQLMKEDSTNEKKSSQNESDNSSEDQGQSGSISLSADKTSNKQKSVQQLQEEDNQDKINNNIEQRTAGEPTNKKKSSQNESDNSSEDQGQTESGSENNESSQDQGQTESGSENNESSQDQGQTEPISENADKKKIEDKIIITSPVLLYHHINMIHPWEHDNEDELEQNEFDEQKSKEPITGTCNVKILKEFGIKISEENEKAQRPFAANAMTKSYCRRNVNSCCFAEEIMQLENHFTKAKKELEERFQPLQEMIVLFKGNRYEEVLFEVDQKEECKKILTDSALYKQAHNEDHFMNTVLPTEIDRMMSLLSDSEIYIKKNYWFFGNMICAICNPNQVNHIHLDAEDPYIEYNINNCAESIEMSEFENRAIMAYEFFFKTWVHLSQCLTGSYEDSDFKVPDLDIKKVNKNLKKYSSCYKNFDFASKECKQLCAQKNFDSYQFPIKFFEATMIALKNIFPVFTEVSLEEFYQKTKQQEPEDIAEDSPINFFEDFKGNKMNKAKIKITNDQGIFIYQNQISKKFYNYVEKKTEKNVVILTVIQTLILLWF